MKKRYIIKTLMLSTAMSMGFMTAGALAEDVIKIGLPVPLR